MSIIHVMINVLLGCIRHPKRRTTRKDIVLGDCAVGLHIQVSDMIEFQTLSRFDQWAVRIPASNRVSNKSRHTGGTVHSPSGSHAPAWESTWGQSRANSRYRCRSYTFPRRSMGTRAVGSERLRFERAIHIFPGFTPDCRFPQKPDAPSRRVFYLYTPLHTCIGCRHQSLR